MTDELGINPRILAFLALVGIFIAIAFGGQFLFPKKSNPEDEQQIIVIEKDVEVLVTPTPDGHLYFASEYQNGTRLLKRPFSWIRNDVLGTMDMKVTTIVYDYKMFNSLHWFNPSTYKYVEAFPETGTKFCLIFIYVFMDDKGYDDTRMWMFNRTFFALTEGANLYFAKDYPYQLRFRELENTKTFNEDTYVQAFKSLRAYSSDTGFAGSAGEYNEEVYYLRGGMSNAVDGFLIYEIPEELEPEEITVLGNFYAFGNAQWRLKF